MKLWARIACKFHADMNSKSFFPSNHRLPALLLVATAFCFSTAHAEKADRLKKMEVESDQSGKADLQNQVVVFNGNVVVTKGTMVIRAARIDIKETADGYRLATATGSSTQPASFRQKREGVNEFIEGEAERLEYDGKSDTVRFVNKASVRQLRGNAVGAEATGALITYDATSELFTVSGSGNAPASTPANANNGRVRFVFTPREGSAAAAEAASQPASAGGSR